MPTPNLGLPYIAEAQSGKEVIHAEDLNLIDRNLSSFRWTLLQAFTPAGTGPDEFEFIVPTIDGQSTAFLLKGAEFLQGTVASTDSTVQVQKSTGGNSAFGAGTDVLTADLTVAAAAFFATTSGITGGTVTSGQRLRAKIVAIGTGGAGWTLNVYASRQPW